MENTSRAEVNAWDFVEKYFPKYQSSDEIAENDDLHKICDGEINGQAEEMYLNKIARIKAETNGTLSDEEAAEKALTHFEQARKLSDGYIFETAIEGYLEQQKSIGELDLATKYKLALQQLQEYSDNKLIIQGGYAIEIDKELYTLNNTKS